MKTSKITAYPVRDKRKSYDICEAFIKGAQVHGIEASVADMQRKSPSLLANGASFFYGIDASNQHLWEQAKLAGSYFYCDNSYFDTARQEYFRVTYGRLQHSGEGTSDCKRFESLNLALAPMRARGEHIVLCPQSDHFMRNVVGMRGDWTQEAMQRLKSITTRPLRLRLWSNDKSKLASTLGDDLAGAHMLVTFSSAAAITAVLSGVPTNCSPKCAAWPVSEPDLDRLESPAFRRPEYIRNWAGVLADNQWTLDEMRSGAAWEKLHAA